MSDEEAPPVYIPSDMQRYGGKVPRSIFGRESKKKKRKVQNDDDEAEWDEDAARVQPEDDSEDFEEVLRQLNVKENMRHLIKDKADGLSLLSLKEIDREQELERRFGIDNKKRELEQLNKLDSATQETSQRRSARNKDSTGSRAKRSSVLKKLVQKKQNKEEEEEGEIVEDDDDDEVTEALKADWHTEDTNKRSLRGRKRATEDSDDDYIEAQPGPSSSDIPTLPKRTEPSKAVREDTSPEATLEDMWKITLKREFLKVNLNEPWFEEAIQGMYVRYADPRHDGHIICQVTGVVKNTREYNIDSTRVNKMLTVEIAGFTKDIRMSFVSNHRPEEDELTHYVSTLKDRRKTFITKNMAEAKRQRFEKMKQHVYTSEEVQKMLEAQPVLIQAAPRDYVSTKEDLQERLENARRDGDLDLMDTLGKQIRQLDEAERLRRIAIQRSSEPIRKINEKARQHNIKMDVAAGKQIKSEAGREVVDLFRRHEPSLRSIWNTNIQRGGPPNSQKHSAPDPRAVPSQPSDSTPLEVAKTEEATPASAPRPRMRRYTKNSFVNEMFFWNEELEIYSDAKLEIDVVALGFDPHTVLKERGLPLANANWRKTYSNLPPKGPEREKVRGGLTLEQYQREHRQDDD